jgi:hypothetical protein
MDKDFTEDVARAMQRQHAKEMFGAIQKWEKISPEERSTWRLIARTTIEMCQQPRTGGEQRAESPATATPTSGASELVTSPSAVAPKSKSRKTESRGGTPRRRKTDVGEPGSNELTLSLPRG